MNVRATEELLEKTQTFIFSGTGRTIELQLPDYLFGQWSSVDSGNLDELICYSRSFNSFRRLIALLIVRINLQASTSAGNEDRAELANLASICGFTRTSEKLLHESAHNGATISAVLGRSYFLTGQYSKAVDAYRQRKYDDLVLSEILIYALSCIAINDVTSALRLIADHNHADREGNNSSRVLGLLKTYLLQKGRLIDFAGLESVLGRVSHNILIHLWPLVRDLDISVHDTAISYSDAMTLIHYFWQRLGSYRPLVSGFQPIKQLRHRGQRSQASSNMAMLFDSYYEAEAYCTAFSEWLSRQHDCNHIAMAVICSNKGRSEARLSLPIIELEGFSSVQILQILRELELDVIIDYTDAYKFFVLAPLANRLAPLQISGHPPRLAVGLSGLYEGFLTDRWTSHPLIHHSVTCLELSGVGVLASRDAIDPGYGSCTIDDFANEARSFSIFLHGDSWEHLPDIDDLLELISPEISIVTSAFEKSSAVIVASWLSVPCCDVLQYLSRGIPVVVYAPHANLHSSLKSILACLGLDVLFAESRESVLEVISALADDKDSCNQLRTSLRTLLKDSLLSDYEGYFDNVFFGIEQIKAVMHTQG